MNFVVIVILMFAIVLGTGLGYYLYTESVSNVWVGMTCDGMLDWSGTDAHQELSSNGHMKFHKYYGEQCTEPMDMSMNMTGGI